MSNIKDIHNCYNCGVCSKICPAKAIHLENQNGFLTPSLDEKICVKCGICYSYCSINFLKKKNTGFHQRYYLFKNKRKSVVKKSRSGGFFFTLGKAIVKKQGIVYGVIIDHNFTIKYSRATNLSSVKKMQGSKYVDANIDNCFELVAKDLKNKESLVLFSGLPCTIKALLLYLRYNEIETNNLITIDIICSGTPSQKIFSNYISLLQKNIGHKIDGFNFRDKRFGWEGYSETYTSKGKKYVSENYKRIFESKYAFKESCFNCDYSTLSRLGDITIGDAWGLKNHNKFNTKEGCSLVLVNNEKGYLYYKEALESSIFESIDISHFIQPRLISPNQKPNNYNSFWLDYNLYGYEYVFYKYCHIDFRNDWKMYSLKRNINKFFLRIKPFLRKIKHHLKM